MIDEPLADTAVVRQLVAALRGLAPATGDADRIDRVRLFEELKSIAAAAQAIETRDFDSSQRAQQAVDGVPVKQQGRGVAGQIGLARRISPWAAQRYLGWAKVLPTELPHTFAALQAGRITEWRATLMARETIWLSREDRAAVDAELGPQLETWGDRRVEAEARKAGYRLDPQGFLARTRGAVTDRRVTMRPAPDAMARLTAFVPVAQGVATYKALCQAADTTTAGGDERGRGQIMADTLVERVTGQTIADAVPVEIELLITDQTLFGGHRNGSHADADHDADQDEAAATDEGRNEPAELIGFGPIPIPADLAREIALGTASSGDSAPRWLRRLFRDPDSGRLVAMESKRRLFTAAQRQFIRLRDYTCRTPWCDAAIRHADHVIPHANGGSTHTNNAAGSCAACNYAKQAGGWVTLPTPDGIVISTPTGHEYLSRPPDPPGAPLPDPSIDRRLTTLAEQRRLAA